MRSLLRWIVCVGVACTGVALAAPDDERARYKAAAQLVEAGELDKALVAIEEGLAIAPKDLELLRLRGAVLLELRDYLGALAAYEAYLDAGARGANRRDAQRIVATLRAVKSTFLEIALAGGSADVYLDAKSRGVFCRAAPSCLKPMLPGEYRVIVEQPGFERWTERVTVAPGQTAKLAVTLVEKPSLLTVRVAQPGARVVVDDAVYAGPITVTAGKHRVVVSLAGHVDARLEVTAREGTPIERDVSLTPIAPVRVAARDDRPATADEGGIVFTGRRKIAVAAGGAGVVAAAVGAVLGLQARGLEQDGYALCPSPTAPCEHAAAATRLNQRARSRAHQANITFGVAGAAALAAAILWLTGAPEPRVAVAPSLAGAGLDVVATF